MIYIRQMVEAKSIEIHSISHLPHFRALFSESFSVCTHNYNKFSSFVIIISFTKGRFCHSFIFSLFTLATSLCGVVWYQERANAKGSFEFQSKDRNKMSHSHIVTVNFLVMFDSHLVSFVCGKYLIKLKSQRTFEKRQGKSKASHSPTSESL